MLVKPNSSMNSRVKTSIWDAKSASFVLKRVPASVSDGAQPVLSPAPT